MAFNVIQIMEPSGKYLGAKFTSEDYDTLEEAKKELEDIRNATERSPQWEVYDTLESDDCLKAGYRMAYYDTVLDRKIYFEMYVSSRSN